MLHRAVYSGCYPPLKLLTNTAMNFGMEISAVVIITLCIFLFASFIHGCIAFGFPMVATPLLSLFTDIQTAIFLTLIPTVLVNLVSIYSEGGLPNAFRRHFLLALFAMLGSAIGTQILLVVHSEVFKLLLASTIIYYLFSEKIKLNFSWVSQFPRLSKVVFGVSAGVLGGLTNVMAPVLIIYSLESKHSKEDIIQASNLCFLFGKMIQLVLFISNGKYISDQFMLSNMGLFVSSSGLFAGITIKKNIRLPVYTKILRVLLFIISISLFVQGTIIFV